MLKNLFTLLDSSGIDEGVIAGVLTLAATYTLIIAVICLALYIIRALGIYKMSVSAGIANPWTAFVPVVNSYIFGRLAERYKRKDGKKSEKFGLLLLIFEILTVITAVCLFIFTVLMLISVLSNAKLAYDNGTDMSLSQFSSLIPVVIFYVLTMLSVVLRTVFHYIALWRIVAVYDYSNATLFTVLSVFFSFLDPIFIFIIRNKEPVFDPKERFPVFTDQI